MEQPYNYHGHHICIFMNQQELPFLTTKYHFMEELYYSYTELNLIFNKNTLCAIQIVTNKTDVSQIGVLMSFINNTADRSGNSIYASPLYNCKQLYTNINNEHLYAKVFEISSDNTNEISSVPVSAELYDTHGILRIYPGFTSILMESRYLAIHYLTNLSSCYMKLLYSHC